MTRFVRKFSPKSNSHTFNINLLLKRIGSAITNERILDLSLHLYMVLNYGIQEIIHGDQFVSSFNMCNIIFLINLSLHLGFCLYNKGAVVALIVWWLDLQLPMQSVSITTDDVSLNLNQGEVYNII